MAKAKKTNVNRRKSEEEVKLQNDIAEAISTLLGSGTTQAQLAEALQLYQPEVSQLYRKKRVFKLERFKEIKDILDTLIKNTINPDEVTEETEKKEPEYNYGAWLFDQLTSLKKTIVEFSNDSGLPYQTLYLIINGITNNPQFKTRQKIQQTLDTLGKSSKTKIEKEPEVTDSKSEDNLFVGLPFIEDEIAQTPDTIGVYAIHDRRGYPTYIGKGRIRLRLKDHSERISFASKKVASTFSYYIIQKGNTDEEKKSADKEARLMEKILTKFAGNTILLNMQNIEDLSQDENI